ncbi:MAG: hypothetical protein ACLU2K_01345 [Clostridia bacterium]
MTFIQHNSSQRRADQPANKEAVSHDGYDNFILGTWDGIDENGQATRP